MKNREHYNNNNSIHFYTCMYLHTTIVTICSVLWVGHILHLYKILMDSMNFFFFLICEKY